MMRLIFYKSVASCFAFEVGTLRNAKKLLARVKRSSEVLNKKKVFPLCFSELFGGFSDENLYICAMLYRSSYECAVTIIMNQKVKLIQL